MYEMYVSYYILPHNSYTHNITCYIAWYKETIKPIIPPCLCFPKLKTPEMLHEQVH